MAIAMADLADYSVTLRESDGMLLGAGQSLGGHAYGPQPIVTVSADTLTLESSGQQPSDAGASGLQRVYSGLLRMAGVRSKPSRGALALPGIGALLRAGDELRLEQDPMGPCALGVRRGAQWLLGAGCWPFPWLEPALVDSFDRSALEEGETFSAPGMLLRPMASWDVGFGLVRRAVAAGDCEETLRLAVGFVPQLTRGPS